MKKVNKTPKRYPAGRGKDTKIILHFLRVIVGGIGVLIGWHLVDLII